MEDGRRGQPSVRAATLLQSHLGRPIYFVLREGNELERGALGRKIRGKIPSSVYVMRILCVWQEGGREDLGRGGDAVGGRIHALRARA